MQRHRTAEIFAQGGVAALNQALDSSSGQQHGFVPVDKQGQVRVNTWFLTTAKLNLSQLV